MYDGTMCDGPGLHCNDSVFAPLFFIMLSTRYNTLQQKNADKIQNSPCEQWCASQLHHVNTLLRMLPSFFSVYGVNTVSHCCTWCALGYM
jgi:hypothetical protein